MPKIICSACQKRISGKYIQALDANWHPDCFRCPICGELIDTNGFMEKAGKPYHPHCYHQKYYPRCSGCGEAIEGRYLRALRKFWHPEHFVCAQCGEPIGENFFAHKGKPYCKKDYLHLFAEKCAICGAALSGRYLVDLWGNRYCPVHEHDPRCSSCDRFIGLKGAAPGHKFADGRILCGECSKTAVTDIVAAHQMIKDIQKVLAQHDFHFDKKLKIPLRMASLHELQSSLHTRRRNSHTAGVTHTNIETLFGAETSREVKRVEVLYGLPYEHMGAVLAHELGHVWLFLNRFPKFPKQVEEGFCEWMAAIWLTSQGTMLAQVRLRMLEKNPNVIYGRGYRAVRKAVENSTPAYVLSYLRRYAELPKK